MSWIDRWRRGRGSPWLRRGLLATGACAVLLLASGTWVDLEAPVGDEAHYLLTAHSVALDGDLNLRPNNLRRDYRHFYPGRLQSRAILRGAGVSVPSQGLLLPLYLAPFYRAGFALGPRYALPAARLGLSLMFLAAIAVVAAGLVRLGLRAPRAWLGAAFGAATLPLWPFAYRVFPELLAALIALLVWRCLAFEGELGSRRAACVAGLISLWPFLGPKYLGLWLGAIGLLVWRTRARRRSLAAALIVLLAGGAAYLATNQLLYGSPSPLAVYGWDRGPEGAQNGSAPGGKQQDYARGGVRERIPNSLTLALGYLIDQKVGLLFHAPYYLLALPGCLSLWRSRPRAAIAVLALVLPHLALVFWHGNWDGHSPPARHLVAVVPFLLMLSVLGAARLRSRGGWIAAGAAAGWSLALSGYAIWREPWLLNRSNWAFPRERSRLLVDLSSSRIDWTRFAPNLIDPEASWWVPLAWLVALGLLAWILLRGCVGAAGAGGARKAGRRGGSVALATTAAAATILLFVGAIRYASSGQLLGPCIHAEGATWCLEPAGGWRAGSNGFWIKPRRWVELKRSGAAAAETEAQIGLLSLVENRVALVGARPVAIEVPSRRPVSARIELRRVGAYGSLWVRARHGSVPFLESARADARHLGVRVKLEGSEPRESAHPFAATGDRERQLADSD
ncbi:MAG TPA: hypothetical protein VGB99_03775 [Acidobacteriota bacterium]